MSKKIYMKDEVIVKPQSQQQEMGRATKPGVERSEVSSDALYTVLFDWNVSQCRGVWCNTLPGLIHQSISALPSFPSPLFRAGVFVRILAALPILGKI